MDPEFRFVLVGFTCLESPRQLRIYEAGNSYAMPAAVARVAERHGFVTETRPADWSPPPAGQAPRALTRGELAEAQAELDALRPAAEAPSPSEITPPAAEESTADPNPTPAATQAPDSPVPQARDAEETAAHDPPPTVTVAPEAARSEVIAADSPAPVFTGGRRSGAGLAFTATALGLSAVWLFIAALALAIAVEWALSRYFRPSVLADATPALRTRLDRISEDLDDLRKASEQQQLLLKSLPLAALSTDIAQNRKAVEALNADVAQNRQAVETLNADVERNRKTAEALSADIGENRKAVERLGPDLRHVKHRVALLAREARELWGAPLRAARPVHRRRHRRR